jgi:FdhD protein
MPESALQIEPQANVEPSHRHPVTRVMAHDEMAATSREIANEVAAAIEFDGSSYAVMMVTPADLEDFAVGFALAERIVSAPDEIARIDIRYGSRGIGIDLRLQQEHSARLAERRRALPGQAGCGICGISTIEEALPQLPVLSSAPTLSRDAIFAALDRLPELQILNRATGAVHAAAFCHGDGTISAVREDVGRHNAFDKLIGHLARSRQDSSVGFALLTSRCSYELVQKAVLARISALVTVSAPTELAVEIARVANLTLIALARRDSFLTFNDPFNSIVK